MAKNSNIVNVGLDAGFGVTKAVSQDAEILFPSVWGRERDLRFEADKIKAKYPGDVVTDDYGTWFVGELALTQLAEQNTRNMRGRSGTQDEIGNTARLRLFKAALGKLFAGDTSGDVRQIRLATGLPVSHMPSSEGLKETFTGQHYINTDNAQFVADVVHVMVMPQPTGALYSQSLTVDGDVNPAYTAMRTAVIDVGTYTIDATLDDDGEYIDAMSDSVEGGMHTAQNAISAMLEREHGQKFRYAEIEQVLRQKRLRIKGQVQDFTAVVKPYEDDVCETTLSLATRLWQAGATIDRVLIAGGGAAVVHEALEEKYSQALLLPKPQLAIAQGYLQYALFTAQG